MHPRGISGTLVKYFSSCSFGLDWFYGCYGILYSGFILGSEIPILADTDNKSVENFAGRNDYLAMVNQIANLYSAPQPEALMNHLHLFLFLMIR